MTGVPASSSSSSSGGATELTYAQITAAVTITATGGGSPDTIVSSAAVVYTGAAVRIDFYAAGVLCPDATALQFNLWDTTSTRLGTMCAIGDGTISPGIVPVFATVFLTPSAGSHTYMVRAHKQVGAGTASVQAGSGASGAYQPCWIRVTSGG